MSQAQKSSIPTTIKTHKNTMNPLWMDKAKLKKQKGSIEKVEGRTGNIGGIQKHCPSIQGMKFGKLKSKCNRIWLGMSKTTKGLQEKEEQGKYGSIAQRDRGLGYTGNGKAKVINVLFQSLLARLSISNARFQTPWKKSGARQTHP